MRRPVVPTVPQFDTTARRLRDSIRDILDWFVAGTRTQELPQLSVENADLVELVKSTGTRYAVPVSEIGTGGSGLPSGGTPTDYLRGDASWQPFPLQSPMFPHTAPPSAPDAWDLDARLMTNPDLAANGWAVELLGSPYTTLTRAGNVDLFSGVTAGTYKSSLVGGTLLLQFNAAQAVTISKATGAGSAFTYKSRVWPSAHASGYITWSFVGNGRWSVGNWYYTGLENTNIVEARNQGGGFTVDVNTAITTPFTDITRYLFSAAFAGSQTASSHLTTALHGQTVNTASLYARSFGSSAIDKAGVILLQGGTGAVHYIDFIRRLPAVTYP